MTRRISLIMCTYGRRELANKCVASVIAQRSVGAQRLELVVVDNSASGYFREDASTWAGRAPFPIVYVHEPQRNVAVARNAGCRMARGDFIVFIDDDERAEPEWLVHLLQAAETSRADAVCGAVLPEFEGGQPPEWDPAGVQFRHT